MLREPGLGLTAASAWSTSSGRPTSGGPGEAATRAGCRPPRHGRAQPAAGSATESSRTSPTGDANERARLAGWPESSDGGREIRTDRHRERDACTPASRASSRIRSPTSASERRGIARNVHHAGLRRRDPVRQRAVPSRAPAVPRARRASPGSGPRLELHAHRAPGAAERARLALRDADGWSRVSRER